MLQKEYLNLTLGDNDEWAHVTFSVAPNSDLELVKQLSKECMASPYLNQGEPPSFWVMDLQKDSILCWVAGWAESPANAWALRSSTRKRIATRLAEHGIKFQLISNSVELPGNLKMINSEP